MFAVVEIGGQQFKVAKGDRLEVKKLPKKEGEKISLDKVYLLNDGKKVEIGTPLVAGAVVEAKILAQKKDEKIRVFKMKPKKRYTRTYGHRSHITEIQIEHIKKKATPVKPKSEDAKPKPKTRTKKKSEKS